MALLGCNMTRQGVAKAIKEGRIKEGATAEEAIKQLSQNSKHFGGGGDRRSAKAIKGIDLGPTTTEAVQVVADELSEMMAHGANATLLEIRTNIEAAKYRGILRQEEKEKGTLVEHRPTFEFVWTLLRSLKDELYIQPQKQSAVFAGMTDPKKIQSLWINELGKTLERAYLALGPLPDDHKKLL
jgi:hypothetical protein